MRKYVFYDTDIEGNEEYDIRGASYELLMRTCCRYSSVLYLKYLAPNMQVYDKLKEFEIEKPQNIPDDPGVYMPFCDKRYYRVCPELCDALLRTANGIFEWLDGWGFHNPDDPVFYRSDGTVFFASEIHEGVCVLAPKENEDVTEVLSSVEWVQEDPRTLGESLFRHLSSSPTKDNDSM